MTALVTPFQDGEMPVVIRKEWTWITRPVIGRKLVRVEILGCQQADAHDQMILTNKSLVVQRGISLNGPNHSAYQ